MFCQENFTKQDFLLGHKNNLTFSKLTNPWKQFRGNILIRFIILQKVFHNGISYDGITLAHIIYMKSISNGIKYLIIFKTLPNPWHFYGAKGRYSL